MAKSTKTTGRSQATGRSRMAEPPPEIADLEDVVEGVEMGAEEDTEGLRFPARIPRVPYPFLLRASGLYRWAAPTIVRQPYPRPKPIPRPIPIRPVPRRPMPSRVEEAPEELREPGAAYADVDGTELGEADMAGLVPFWFRREDLRLDVDGRYPQMVVSGTIYSGVTMRVHWIANLTKIDSDSYAGPIWYKDGAASWLPHTNVRVDVVRSWYSNQRRATVRFTGGGAPTRVRTYGWKSWSYRTAEFEYDAVSGTSAVTTVDTGAHPNRPASLPTGNLSLETVYRRAGFRVAVTPGSGTIPLSGAGSNARWSDAEMHDAMQVYWSRFADKPQWSLWVLFAALHERGTSLGGIMFDDIGPNHRQGTAIFNDAFISNPPPGDPAPDAWVRRMRFWTAAHEMGHAFNLAHSWQKALVHQGHGPWIPLANEPEARSFMNYPYNVSGGQDAFFDDFEYRFSDSELLFLRHAPERFVEMGDADWFDDHGFEQAETLRGSPYRLELRAHREEQEYFDFLEPVVLELKLSNASTDPVVVDANVLESSALTVVVKRRNEPAKTWHPFAEYCQNGTRAVLMPATEPGAAGEAIYGPLRLTGGVGGWSIDEPGYYTVPPRGFDEELIAQDFFTEDVARVLTFSGSGQLTKANAVLEEVVDRLGERKVSRHALVALATPRTKQYKTLEISEKPAGEAGRPEMGFMVSKVKAGEAEKKLKKALLDDPAEAAETLGHIGYGRCVHELGTFMAEHVEPTRGAGALETAKKAMEKRGVKESVLKEMASRASALKKKGAAKTKKKTKKKKK